MECKQKSNIDDRCNCTYSACGRKGICCDCLAYHLRQRQLPACCFPNDVEQTFDRSFSNFANLVNSGNI